MIRRLHFHVVLHAGIHFVGGVAFHHGARMFAGRFIRMLPIFHRARLGAAFAAAFVGCLGRSLGFR